MPTQIVRRLYFYIAAFIGLQLLAAGGRQIIAVLLERLLWSGAIGGAELSVARLSSSVALIVVGLPLWAIHWYVAQRGLARPEDQRSTLRRLYGYAVLLVAMLGGLFAVRRLLLVLIGAGQFGDQSTAAGATAALVVHALIWGYHWRVFAADRMAVEQSGGTATLRRWYLVIVQAFGLGMASYGAAQLVHQILQPVLTPSIGETIGLRASIAAFIAGSAVWLPHHLWGRTLLHTPGPLRDDEARSVLRQVYAALVVTAAAVAALGGLGALVAAVLLAVLGGATWRTVISDHTQAIGTVLIAVPVWRYHLGQIAEEAGLSDIAARGETARRVIGYLMAAIGLGALFFGLGGLAGTLLRLGLAPDTLGGAWREPLSLYLALAIVALPVYSIAFGSMERMARRAGVEEHTLARRIYLYAALLFGIVAAIVAVVALVQRVVRAVLGAAEPALAADVGRWLGYAVIGAAIAAYHIALLRRAGRLPADAGAGVTIVVFAAEPLGSMLQAAFEHEMPAVTVRRASIDDPAALDGAQIVAVALQAVLDSPAAASIQAFRGRRLLLTTGVAGYELLGAGRSNDALVRDAVQALRATLTQSPAGPETAAADASPDTD